MRLPRICGVERIANGAQRRSTLSLCFVFSLPEAQNLSNLQRQQDPELASPPYLTQTAMPFQIFFA